IGQPKAEPFVLSAPSSAMLVVRAKPFLFKIRPIKSFVFRISFVKSLFFNDQCIFFEILADHEVFNSGASRFFPRVRRVSLGWPGLMFGVVVWSAWDPFFLIFCWRLGWFGTFVGRSPYRFA